MNSDTSIFVGCHNDTAWVRIEGVATKDTSSGIRRYFTESFEEGLRSFIIDLEECRFIDSTFIGILTALAGNIAASSSPGSSLNRGGVRVVHPNERNEKSICKLGLDNLITIDRDGRDSAEVKRHVQPCLNRLECGESPDKLEKAAMILHAHEVICSANTKNQEEFADVLDFLRKEVDQSSKN